MEVAVISRLETKPEEASHGAPIIPRTPVPTQPGADTVEKCSWSGNKTQTSSMTCPAPFAKTHLIKISTYKMVNTKVDPTCEPHSD